MTHLILSPHFDDAVLSCGGIIHHLVKSGQTVDVRTVMAGEPVQLPETPLVHDLHARWQEGDNPVQARIQEDEVALWKLGAKVSRMVNWTDCIYRTARDGEALYPEQPTIFGEIHPKDQVAQLLPTIVLKAHEVPRTIYAPLGAGHHVDHQIVRNWALTLKQYYPWVALKFYEEYPYTEKPQAVDQALTYLRSTYPALHLELEVVPLTEDDIQGKLDAIFCYKSQISSFWKNYEQMEYETRQSLTRAGDGTPSERYWVVV
jgi:LmbE family N-acetylglucosaminyl deacetylase